MVHWPVHMYSVLDVPCAMSAATSPPRVQRLTCGLIPETVTVVDVRKLSLMLCQYGLKVDSPDVKKFTV
jgi:hypothetical protein